MKKLTQKQAKFAELIANGKPIIKSFIDAGYSAKEAKKNYYNVLHEPHVQEEIQLLKKMHREECSFITKEYVIEQLRVITDESKNEANKIKALALLCKILGFEDTTIKVQSNEPLYVIMSKEDLYDDVSSDNGDDSNNSDNGDNGDNGDNINTNL